MKFGVVVRKQKGLEKMRSRSVRTYGQRSGIPNGKEDAKTKRYCQKGRCSEKKITRSGHFSSQYRG